jgi:hypothetical protein
MFLKLFSQKRKMFAYTSDFGLVMLNTKSDDDSKKGQFLQNHCKFLPSFIRHHKYADPLYIIVLQLFSPIYHARAQQHDKRKEEIGVSSSFFIENTAEALPFINRKRELQSRENKSLTRTCPGRKQHIQNGLSKETSGGQIFY